MTNRYLPSRYIEIVQRLAVSIEPVDAYRGARVPPPLLMLRDEKIAAEVRLRLRDERGNVTSVLPRVGRSNTCRFKLLYAGVTYDHADPWLRVRLVQGFNEFAPRHFVPRRLEIPVLDPATADAAAFSRRVHRPALFPGADYPVHDSVTGLRGRVTRAGHAMPWARVEARRMHNGTVGTSIVGRAHGDDRGEFLLLVDSGATAPGGATMAVTLRLTVYGPSPAPVPPPPIEAATDPHWSMPVERLPLTSASSDAVSRGDDPPPGYTASTSRDVTLRLGVLSSELNSFVIV